jgi:hypothetical protein
VAAAQTKAAAAVHPTVDSAVAARVVIQTLVVLTVLLVQLILVEAVAVPMGHQTTVDRALLFYAYLLHFIQAKQQDHQQLLLMDCLL